MCILFEIDERNSTNETDGQTDREIERIEADIWWKKHNMNKKVLIVVVTVVNIYAHTKRMNERKKNDRQRESEE